MNDFIKMEIQINNSLEEVCLSVVDPKEITKIVNTIFIEARFSPSTLTSSIKPQRFC